jgi:hypothetical protein
MCRLVALRQLCGINVGRGGDRDLRLRTNLLRIALGGPRGSAQGLFQAFGVWEINCAMEAGRV